MFGAGLAELRHTIIVRDDYLHANRLLSCPLPIYALPPMPSLPTAAKIYKKNRYVIVLAPSRRRHYCRHRGLRLHRAGGSATTRA